MAGRGGAEGAARRLARRDGKQVLRPMPDGAEKFPLTYVRTLPRSHHGGRFNSSTPVLLLPGGPGLASVVPYARLRDSAARLGMDVVMVEHRGIGMSRHDSRDKDLPVEAVTVEHVVQDLDVVLDHARIERVVLYGCSYGTYLAQAFGARYPGRVAAMILDSTMLSVEDDLAAVRAHRRRLFWNGEEPALAAVAAAARALAADDVPMAELDRVVQVVYEFAGPEALHRLLLARRQRRLTRTWTYISKLGLTEISGPGAPYILEPDLVSGITFGQLGYALPPDDNH